MNIIIFGLLICAISISLSLNYVFLVRINKLQNNMNLIYDMVNINKNDLSLLKIKHEDSVKLIKRLEQAQEDYQPTTPIKPNNWDSVKEAFKGPVRIEINERN